MSKYRILFLIVKILEEFPDFGRIPMGKDNWAKKINDISGLPFSPVSRNNVKSALKLGIKYGIIEKCEALLIYGDDCECSCYRLKDIP